MAWEERVWKIRKGEARLEDIGERLINIDERLVDIGERLMNIGGRFVDIGERLVETDKSSYQRPVAKPSVTTTIASTRL